MPQAERSPTGYRLYTEADVELLTFIRRARSLGLRLEDVREVLEIRRGGTPPCEAVRHLLDDRVAEIDAAVADLLALRQTLAQTREMATGRPCADSATVCSIIEDA